MKIYTRTGDSGDTALFGGGRVRKDDVRVEAYGAVDELNAAIGLAVEAMQVAGEVERLRGVQADLMTLGAHLATPDVAGGNAASRHLPPLPEEKVARMEEWIDQADERLEPLRSFILPGGSDAAAHLHVARAVCRRAERRVLTLSVTAPIDGTIIVYLNRLSDLLFTMARLANAAAGVDDVTWQGRP